MKVLAKLFYALAIISMVSIGIGVVVAIWFNALIGLKVVSISCISMAVCALVVCSLDIYR